MDQASLEARLNSLPIGAIRYFDSVSSTNDIAAQWVAEGAPDLSLVIADEQTKGRGRGQRRWFTPPRSALAFSLILLPTSFEDNLATHQNTARLNGLGALAVFGALKKQYGLPAQIKWPNDVLLNQHKVAGVLTESKWDGNHLSSIVLGIGINVAPESVPPADQLNYPATCVEAAAGKAVNRQELLYAVLGDLLNWRAQINTPEFITLWENNLAMRGQKVRVSSDSGNQLEGQIEGLNPNGSLRLRVESGEIVHLQIGEIPSVENIRIRPD